MIIGITGHRPNKLGGYDNSKNKSSIIKALLAKLFLELKPTQVVVGMALGIDQWAAEVALELNIPVLALIPCAGQDCKWPPNARYHYKDLLRKITRKGGLIMQLSNDPYRKELMHRRNGEIIKRCNLLVAVWDGTPGGTSNCVGQARMVDKNIVQINPNTLKVEKIHEGHPLG